MQFDAVGMSRCHGELLGASSLPESLTVKLDGEGKTEVVQALGLTTTKLAWHKREGWNKHIVVVPLLCCVIVAPCPCYPLSSTLSFHRSCVSARQVGKKVCLPWYLMIKNNEIG